MHENARLSGYQILVDGKPLGGLRNPDIEQMVINNMVPGTRPPTHTPPRGRPPSLL